MRKSRWMGLLCGILLLALVLTGCEGLTTVLPKVTLENGNVYAYWPDNEIEGSFSLNGVALYEASKEELREALRDEIPDYTAGGKITTSKKAAYCGATVLDMAYEEWTQVNTCSVDYNKDTDVWLVHGMLESRVSPVIPLGIIALDGATGEVIAIGLTHTDVT